MADDEADERVRDLAVAVIEDSREHAHGWAKVRADAFRSEGDVIRAKLWDRVAAMVLKIQRGAAKHGYH